MKYKVRYNAQFSGFQFMFVYRVAIVTSALHAECPKFTNSEYFESKMSTKVCVVKYTMSDATLRFFSILKRALMLGSICIETYCTIFGFKIRIEIDITLNWCMILS